MSAFVIGQLRKNTVAQNTVAQNTVAQKLKCACVLDPKKSHFHSNCEKLVRFTKPQHSSNLLTQIFNQKNMEKYQKKIEKWGSSKFSSLEMAFLSLGRRVLQI
ncbi:hypothetical protein RF11_03722 [Thelohanellus kitauei]|uniref:Uncharacterized protein n=1 Tax=Thelohanellus kitauei TaxID=669202 RepID=A0A0C2MR12_THEKT|nr:hypothetical protein RF11_03722 [Thelohanellus kitauei]